MRRAAWMTLARVAIVVGLGHVASAAPVGGADGGFEAGFAGMTVVGDASVVPRLGVLAAPQGGSAARLTTAPDAGSEPGDADVATVTFPAVGIAAGVTQLRLDAVFLTDEPTPSLTNDRFSVILRNQTTAEETPFAGLDTFGPFHPAPWTGYAAQSGWRQVRLDLSALAGTPDLYDIVLRLEDVGDGRRNSAVLIDNVRLVGSGLPIANAGMDYAETTIGANLAFNGFGSTDDGTIVEYRWDFGDGTMGTGPAGSYAYTRNGTFQGSLTVTDDDGNTDTDFFTVQVGPVNTAPRIVSEPGTTAAETVLYAYEVGVEDAQLLFGDTLTFALTVAPDGMAIDPASGRITWVPTSASPRTNPVTVRVTDSLGLSDTQSFSVAVSAPKLLMAAVDDSGSVYVAESNGDGTWSTYRRESTIGNLSRGITIADFTGDGYLDILTATATGGALRFYLLTNDGTNRFTNRGIVGSAAVNANPYGMAAGDLNHDGFMDVIASIDSRHVVYGLGNGNGAFTFTVVDTGQGSGRAVDIGDVNQDGHPDFVRAIYSSGQIRLYLGNGNGTFTDAGVVADPGDDPYGMVLGDFDNDGFLDIVAEAGGSGDSYFYRGNGTGTFQAGVYVSGPDLNNHATFGGHDFNGDGNLDIVLGNYSGRRFHYARGNGDGTFQAATAISTVNTDNNVLGIAAPPVPPPAGYPKAVVNPNPVVAGLGATVDFDASLSTVDAGAPWWDAAWGQRQTIILDNRAGAAATDVGVPLTLAFQPGMAADFADLRFTDLAGTELTYRVTAADPGVSLGVEVTVASLPGAARSRIYVYSGNPGAAPGGGGPAAPTTVAVPYRVLAPVAPDQVVRYQWDFGDGGTAEGLAATHTFPAVEAPYAVRLTIRDDWGRIAIGAGRVRILGDPPVAAAGGPYVFGETSANAGVWTVALSGTGSSDSSGNPVTYRWDLGNNLNEQFNLVHRGNLPIPGLWAHSDQVTVSAGEAVVVGAGSWGNRYLVTRLQYPRVPGDSFRGRLRANAGGNRHIMWGLKNTNDDFNHTQFHYAIYFDNGAVRIYEGGSHRANVGSFTDGVTYELRIDVKAFGADYYMRQAGAPTWTLLYNSLYTDSSPMRFGATIHSGTHALDSFTTANGASTAAAPTAVYPRAGVYTVALTVTDTVAQSDTDSTTVSLVPGAPPVANPGGPYVLGEAAANCDRWTVTFNGTGSTDDTAIYQYVWTFGDGSTGSGATPTYTYAAAGEYTVTLTVIDHALQSHTATTTVRTVPGDPPVADPGGPYAVDESAANGGFWTVAFSAAGSTDDRGICDYAWDFGDGGSGTGVSPTHLYAAVGVYTVTLTVRDHALQAHSETTTVTVTAGDPPVARPGDPYDVDESFATNGVWTFRLDGSASSDDYGIFTYEWDFGDISALRFGPGGSDAVTIADAEGLRPEFVTVAAWVYPTSMPNWATVLMKSTTSSWNNGYGLMHTNGSNDIRFFVNDYTLTYAETTIPLGKWSFVAGTYDGATVRIYVDGDLRAFAPAAAAITHSNGILEIGNGSGGNYPWNGSLDDVSLWRRALTMAEIRTLMTVPPTGAEGDLVAYWDFADGTATDRTGNGFDGALTGGVVPSRATGTGVSPTHGFTRMGTFTVSLTVTDHARQSHSATTQVVVHGNEVPVADAGPDLITEVGVPVVLDAFASTDDLGIARTYWNVGAEYGWMAGNVGQQAEQIWLVGNGSWTNTYWISQATFPRTAGHSFTGKVAITANSTSNRYAMWGLKDASANPNYTVFPYAVYFNNGTLRVYESGSDRGQKGTYIEGRTYEVRIDLKAAGATYYVRLEGATAWTQIHDSTFSTASPLRIGCTVNQGLVILSDFAGPDGPLPVPPAMVNTESRVEVVYQTPGIYQPSVTVTDHAMQFHTDSKVVTVIRGSPPVANNGGPYFTQAGFPTRLNGRSSRDDFGIKWYDWDFGDGERLRTRNPWADHVYTTPGTYLLALTVTDYSGQTSIDTSSVNVSSDPVVACVPWKFQGGIEVPHDTLSGREVILKAVCWSIDPPLTYTWDFGDGSPTVSGTVTNTYKVEARHTYTGIEGMPFIANLTITDASGRTARDSYLVRIRPPSIDVEINIAIDNGLWWLHGRMNRGEFAPGTYTDARIQHGYWTNANGYGGTGYTVNPTASAGQAFLVNGHREIGDTRQDPYVETAARALRYLPHALRPIGIGPQTYGDPDTNRNRIGLELSVSADFRHPYEVGPAMDALVASGMPEEYAFTGRPGLLHRSYREMVVDMVDVHAWGQSDGAAGGGWRYTWHEHPDNSAAQWGAIGLIPAEEVFKIPVPQWVKDRNDVWISYSYNGTGFGYTGAGNGNCTTPSGMVQLAFVGVNAIDDPDTPVDDRDPRWRTAEDYIASQWNTSWWYPNSSHNNRYAYYAYYAFAKAMRTAKPQPVERLKSTGLDWFKDDTRGMARRLINRQLADGGWPKDNDPGSWVGDDLTVGWSVLILSPTLFVQPPVADAGENRVWGVDVELRLDGSRSYHVDPFRSIVRYEWDVDGDGIFDTSSTSDPTVRVTYGETGILINGAPGGSSGQVYPPDTLPLTIAAVLRVTDNNDPSVTDSDTVTILLAIPPRPPIADTGGPYHARIGVPITLDGSGSFDIDPTDFITAWQWDLNSDGLFDDATGETVEMTFTEVGIFNIALRVTDNAVMNDLNSNGVQDVEERLEGIAFTTVTVTTNRAPNLNRSAQLFLTTITEDTEDPPGSRIETVLGSDSAVPDPITDLDDDPEGIAVTGLASTGPGTWQYRLTDGDAWAPFGDVSTTAATLLPGGAWVRFVPVLAYNNGQTATLTFQAWDQTSGTAGDTGVDVSVAGGFTAFSLAFSTMAAPVLPVNDAPVLAAGTDLTFTPITEDTEDPPGDAVAEMLLSDPAVPDAITDPDFGALEGIAVLGLANPGPGQWQYLLPGATEWVPFGVVNDAAATLLPADARVRFVPDLAYNNGQTAVLTFRAWDQSAGAPGQTGVDATLTGSTTAFSPSTAQARLLVADVNDAPVLDPAAVPVFTAIDEDAADPAGNTVAQLLASDPALADPIADPDTGALDGIAVTGTTATAGTWQMAAPGEAWAPLPPVSGTEALLLLPEARLRFVPNPAHNNGQTATVTFRAWDRTSGTAGDRADASANGGTTAFSTTALTATLTVTDVNDAPVLDPEPVRFMPDVTAGTEEPPGSAIAAILGSSSGTDGITDPDVGAVKGIAVSSAGGLGGATWQYRLPGSDPWTAFPALPTGAALLLPLDAEVRLLPPAFVLDDTVLTVTFRAWDRTAGTAGGVGDSTVVGGTSAFSAAADTWFIVVRAGGEATENWWYPAFTWRGAELPGKGSAKSADDDQWYHVQVFDDADLTVPFYEANVLGTTMTVVEYFLAAFDGFPQGAYRWRFRPWDPATDTYGAFTPATLAGAVDPAYTLNLTYGHAAAPTGLAIANTAPGVHLLSFLVGNARAYEVRAVREGDGQTRTWRHAFIPGEDPDKVKGDPALFGLDNPPMDPPLIPRDEPATLAVNLPEPGVYRVYIRGFNPTDERDGMPSFVEFPQTIVVDAAQPAVSPPRATGMVPAEGSLIAMPAGVAVMPQRLQWDPMVGAQRFILYLAAANATPLFNFEDVGGATRLEVALPPGSYTWEVVGISEDGAVPATGTWSESGHFQVVRDLVRPAMAARIERLDDTRVRLYWMAGGSVPDLVEIRHFRTGSTGWFSHAPQTMLNVDLATRSGEVEIADLARPGTHYLLVRGHSQTPAGELRTGEARLFFVPALVRRGAPAGPFKPK